MERPEDMIGLTSERDETIKKLRAELEETQKLLTVTMERYRVALQNSEQWRKKYNDVTCGNCREEMTKKVAAWGPSCLGCSWKWIQGQLNKKYAKMGKIAPPRRN